MALNKYMLLRVIFQSWLSQRTSCTLKSNSSVASGDGRSNDTELGHLGTAVSGLVIPMDEVKQYIAGSCVFLQPLEGDGCLAVTSMGKLVTRTDGETCEEFETGMLGQTLRSRTTENCLAHTGDGMALEACTSENQFWQKSSAPGFCKGSICLKTTLTKIRLLSVAGECVRYRDLMPGGSGGCVSLEYEASDPDGTFPLRLDSQCLELVDDLVTPQECNGNFRQKFVRVAERVCTLDGFGLKTICFEIQGFQPPIAPDSYAAYFKQHTESQKVGVPRADDVKPLNFESFEGKSGTAESDGGNNTLMAFWPFGGNRHASTWLSYKGTATWWYNEVKALHAPRDTYYMVNGHAYGYAGIQWASSWLPFLPLETKVLCSIWDPPSCSSNDKHACPEHSRAKVVQCGPGVQCSDRFGGEGSGAKSVLSTALRTGSTYGFMTSIHPIGNGKVRQSCHLHDPSSGWRLISTIEVAHEGRYQGLHGMGSFLEDWTGRDGNAPRNAQYGPSFTSNDGSQPQTFSQTEQVSFVYGQGRPTETVHTSHGYQTGYQVGMATGGHGYPQTPSGTMFSIPRVGLPNALQSFINSFAGDGGSGGDNGGNGGAPSSVNCGGHSASNCASCPQGNGAGWCNGDCYWGSGQCLNRNSAFLLSFGAGVVPLKVLSFALTFVVCSILRPSLTM